MIQPKIKTSAIGVKFVIKALDNYRQHLEGRVSDEVITAAQQLQDKQYFVLKNTCNSIIAFEDQIADFTTIALHLENHLTADPKQQVFSIATYIPSFDRNLPFIITAIETYLDTFMETLSPESLIEGGTILGHLQRISQTSK